MDRQIRRTVRAMATDRDRALAFDLRSADTNRPVRILEYPNASSLRGRAKAPELIRRAADQYLDDLSSAARVAAVTLEARR
jgi:hypothetical protein